MTKHILPKENSAREVKEHFRSQGKVSGDIPCATHSVIKLSCFTDTTFCHLPHKYFAELMKTSKITIEGK